MDVLRRMTSLEWITPAAPGAIAPMSADEFWKKYDAGEFRK
jgi:hypothetical protein